MTRTAKLLIAAVALAAAPAQAATFTEGFAPFAGWKARWFGANSNAANYYASEYDDPTAVDYQGAPDNGGLVLTDGDNYLSPGDYAAIRVRFDRGFAADLTNFRMDVATALPSTVLTFFDLADRVIGTYTVAGSTLSPYGTPTAFRTVSVSSAGGIGGFALDGFAQGNVVVDNLVAVTAAAVPEPAAWFAMVLGFGAIGLGVRGRSVLPRQAAAA